MTRDGENGSGRRPAGVDRAFREAASRSIARTVAQGAACYERSRMLPRLLGLDPSELAKDGPELRAAISARLERALRDERRRGRAGHWTYDLNRHLALAQALAGEEALARAAARLK